MFCKDCSYINKKEWCKKTGGKVRCGTCGDEELLHEENQSHQKQKTNKRKETNKQERKEKGKHKLQQMSKLYHGAYFIEEKFKLTNGNYKEFLLTKPYYKRFYRSKHSWYTYLKKYSNKIIRQYKGEIPSGNYCKKIYDLRNKK